MNLYGNELYMEDVRYVADLDLPWEKLKNRRVMLSGASGMIGSFLTDVLMQRNCKGDNITVYALGRSEERVRKRFPEYLDDEHFIFTAYDVRNPFEGKDPETADYVLHLASNTHPLLYSTDPIGTVATNIIGLQNLLEFAVKRETKRFAFASSNEIYGENRGDVEFFDEKYCGYIDCNTLRAGYPESKRCGEALCQAYKSQMGLDVVIPRFTRSYGPTMRRDDTKAVSQFIRKAVDDEDIVLKSAGTQKYSYTYTGDAVSGLLTVLLGGESGEAYNIADEASDIMLRDLASIIAEAVGRKVVFELPDAIEAAGYSTATKARLDGSRLKALGWHPRYDIKKGMERTIRILKQVYGFAGSTYRLYQ